MDIAIVGSGIAGLSCAWALQRGGHQVSVYEVDARIGGHVNTIDVPGNITGNKITTPVDTGFIVYNHRTYPHFMRLLQHLNVAGRDTTMSFSVRDDQTGIEYNGHTFNSLFSQRRNFFRPSHWRMIRDIIRFNREAPAVMTNNSQQTLGSYLDEHGYSAVFRERYLLPMGAAIWSMAQRQVLAMPIAFFVTFFKNHGFLEIDNRPTWRTVVGGSRAYLAPLCAHFSERIFRETPVLGVERLTDGVQLHTSQGIRRHDHVVLACHSDQALRMLRDPSVAERDILSAIPYTENEAVLHSDISVMPRRKLSWAAWNYHRMSSDMTHAVPVTYDMNALQGLATETPYLVTLNFSKHIDEQKIIRRITYHHPDFTTAAVAAQKRWGEISHHERRTWFAGAYWRYGFHEDGLMSGLRVYPTAWCQHDWQREHDEQYQQRHL
jgi:uncharacterized protein